MWTDGVADFGDGERTDVRVNGSDLTLDPARDWLRRSDGSPVPTDSQGMVFDSLARVVVLFGGRYSRTREVNETWLYDIDERDWSLRSPAASPSPREAPGMVFDEGRGIVVLFGGLSGETYQGDTWTYNVSTDVWKKMSPAVSPDPRAWAMMVYDSAHGLVVLFGGSGNHCQFGDTWTYESSTDNWANVTPASGPFPRIGQMAFDSRAGKCIYLGGWSMNETWTFDAGTLRWTEMKPGDAPSVRSLAAMVYDSWHDRTLLQGGYNSGSYEDDFWSYDLGRNEWSLVERDSDPAFRAAHSMVFDPATGTVVLFGGGGDYWPHYGIWTLDTSSMAWTYQEPKVPPWRYGHGMAFDSRMGAAVLFGGKGGFENDTWTYNVTANRWKRMNPPISPPGRTFHSMAFDERAGIVVLFGGIGSSIGSTNLCDTWIYDVGSDMWTQASPATHPAGRRSAAMAYDPVAGGEILFGGIVGNTIGGDTWKYDAVNDTWTRLFPTTSVTDGRAYASMAFDPETGELVLFGGEDDSHKIRGETWTYSSTRNNWTDRKPPSSPGPRETYGMAYCDKLRGVLLFGGWSLTQSYIADTWLYRASTNRWTGRDDGSAVPGRSLSAMVYDAAADAIVLFGGNSGNLTLDDTWAYLETPGFCREGTYVSPPFDSGGRAFFGTFDFETSGGAATSLLFQLRTADTKENLTRMPFIGPAGDAASHYARTGQPIHQGHNGSRWIQYIAYFGTSNNTQAPVLKEVRIRYNLMHEVALEAPAGGEVWTGNCRIAWNLSDPDMDVMLFDLDLLTGDRATRLATDLPNQTRQWVWNTTSVRDGTYRIRITARDRSSVPLAATALSGPLTIEHPPPPNHPPTAILLAPADGATTRSSTVMLAWEGLDEDWDSLSYLLLCAPDRVRVEEGVAVIARQNGTVHTLTGLVAGTYYWTVVPNDGKDNGTSPGIWSFTVALANRPPCAFLLSPPNGSTVNSTAVELRWNGTDEENDTVQYTVSAAENLSEVLSGIGGVPVQTRTAYCLTGLRDGGEYFWTVVPNDGKGNGSARERFWSFRVELPRPNRIPTFTSVPLTHATVGREYIYDSDAKDEDGDVISYSLAWAPAGMRINGTTGRINWTPAPDQAGKHQVVVGASDGRGLAEQRFSVEVGVARVPVCTIVHPPSGGKVSGRLGVRGTAAAGELPIERVELRLDGGTWSTASGTVNWTFRLDTGKLGNGIHTLEARAFDGGNYSNVSMVKFRVENPPPANSLMPAAAVLAILVAAVAAVAIARKRWGPPGG